MRDMAVFWAEKSSPDIGGLSRKYRVAIFPVGSTEQHGPHLPTGTDHIIAWELSKRVAEEIDALLLPLLPYGFSDDHFPKPGTISISADTLKGVIRDVANSLNRNGLRHLVIVSGHAGHLGQISDIAYQLNLALPPYGLRVHNISPYTAVPVERLGTILEEEMFIHAEELETSLMLYLRPELVDMGRAVKEHPDFIPRGLTTPNFLEAIRIVTTSKFLGRDFETGVCGDATLATREKGEKLFSLLVSGLVEAIKHVTRE
ncbi:Creatinine amidohydrolase [archaeon HR01]|nr:Creatinine amidohydrolase [archaeon HR01]